MGTRRRFLRDCSALAVSAALGPVPAMAVPRPGQEVSLDDLSFRTFAALVRTAFFVRDAEGRRQMLALLEAEPAAPDGDGFGGAVGGESFSLSFRGEATRPLRQDTYAFEHARVGRFPMFIVPVGREDRNHCYYEAVFHRLPPELFPRELPVGPRHRGQNERPLHG